MLDGMLTPSGPPGSVASQFHLSVANFTILGKKLGTDFTIDTINPRHAPHKSLSTTCNHFYKDPQ